MGAEQVVMRTRLLAILLLLPMAPKAAEDLPSQLKSTAQDMREATEKLREDRHDGLVQLKMSSIEDKLEAIIAAAEKQQQQEQKEQRQKERQQRQREQKREEARQQQPLQDSRPMPPVPSGPTEDPAIVADRQSRWARLPPAQRDELIQAYKDELPERWKKRLEAYFASLAAEEVRKK